MLMESIRCCLLSNNESAVIVVDNGNGSALATAVGQGTALITAIANYGSGISDSITITVNGQHAHN